MTGFVDVARGSGEPRKFVLVSFHVCVCFIFLQYSFLHMIVFENASNALSYAHFQGHYDDMLVAMNNKFKGFMLT